MLKCVYFLSLTLLTSYITIAQKSDVVPTGSKYIIVTLPDSSITNAYKLIASHLINNGYTIANSDKELGFVNTERKQVKYTWEVRISASVVGNKVRFTGKQFMPGFDKSETQIEFFGMKGAMYKTCFNEVNRVASTFPNISITYEK